MTVRVEQLEAPAPSPTALAAERLLAVVSAALLGWWRRPTGLIMSEDWLNEHARNASKGRSY
jgi:hypothetical protein